MLDDQEAFSEEKIRLQEEGFSVGQQRSLTGFRTKKD